MQHATWWQQQQEILESNTEESSTEKVVEATPHKKEGPNLKVGEDQVEEPKERAVATESARATTTRKK